MQVIHGWSRPMWFGLWIGGDAWIASCQMQIWRSQKQPWEFTGAGSRPCTQSMISSKSWRKNSFLLQCPFGYMGMRAEAPRLKNDTWKNFLFFLLVQKPINLKARRSFQSCFFVGSHVLAVARRRAFSSPNTCKSVRNAWTCSLSCN